MAEHSTLEEKLPARKSTKARSAFAAVILSSFITAYMYLLTRSVNERWYSHPPSVAGQIADAYHSKLQKYGDENKDGVISEVEQRQFSQLLSTYVDAHLRTNEKGQFIGGNLLYEVLAQVENYKPQ